MSGSGKGIECWGMGNNAVIRDNTIYGFKYGMYFHSGSAQVYDNNIYNNSQYGIYNYTTTMLTAINNWWGHASGPLHTSSNDDGLGNQVSDNVSYSPWRAAPVYNGETNGGIIYGKVTNSVDGLPVPGASVRTSNNHYAIHPTYDDGKYVIPDVPYGTGYSVIATAMGYVTAQQSNVSITQDNSIVKIDFVLTPDSSTSLVSNLMVSQRTDGSMLMDIYYDLYSTDDGPSTIEMSVSSNGGISWDFECSMFIAGSDIGVGISPGLGRHIIWDIGTEHPETTQELLIKVNVQGATSCAISPMILISTLGSNSSRYILGSVSDESGTLLSEVDLIVTGMNYQYSTQTNESGQFTISNLNINQVNILAVKDGYESASQTVTLNPGANYCHISLAATGPQLDALFLSPKLMIYADNIVQSPANFYTLTGNVNINGILKFMGQVTVDKRPYLTYPLLITNGELRAIDIMGEEPTVIPNPIIPISYVIIDDELVPHDIYSIVEAVGQIGGFEFEIGRLKISEADDLGQYVEAMALLKPGDDNFFTKIIDWRSNINPATPPVDYMPDLEQLSFNMYYARNTGVEIGGGLYGFAMNFGVFRIDDLSVSYDPVGSLLQGSLNLKIPGVGTLRDSDDFSTTGLDLPVTVNDTGSGRVFSTDLGKFIEMNERGIFHQLEFDALMEFSSGSLSSLEISISGMDIPIFATGAFIRAMYGSVYDLGVNDLMVEATVDIGLHSNLDIPLLGPVVSINDVGFTIKPWSYFSGEGEFQIFKQTVAGGKVFYDRKLNSLGLEANLMLMMEMNDPGSSILNGQLYGNVSADQFNAGVNAHLKTPDNLPWYLNWAEGLSLASVDASIHNFELSSMLQIYNLSLAQKITYGKPSFPWFHYSIGPNYKSMVQLWKGTRGGRHQTDFQVPENASQIMIVAGNNSNLFDFSVTSPDGTCYDSSDEGYHQFASTNQTMLVIDNPKMGNWTFSTDQLGEITTEFMVLNQAPSVLVSMPSSRGSRDNNISLSLGDYADTLNVRVYYDTDDKNYNGTLIQEFLAVNNADLDFIWHNNDVPDGEYYIYTRIDDGKNSPVYQYAPGSIIVDNYHVEIPQNVQATVSDDEINVSWNEPTSGNIVFTEILVEDIYAKTQYSYSVIDQNNYSITDLPKGREYKVSCRFTDSEFHTSDYSLAGNVFLSNGTRNNPPYFTMDKDDVWVFVENQPGAYPLTAINPDGGGVDFFLQSGLNGMNISGNTFRWTPSADQRGYYQQPIVVTNGAGSDMLYQQISVYSEEQAAIRVRFSSPNLYEADRLFIKINNIFSDEPLQDVTLTNLHTNAQATVTCRRVNKFEYVGQFALSVSNRSLISVEDGDEVEVTYQYGGNTYNSFAIYSSNPQPSDRIPPAAITDLQVTRLDNDSLKLSWVATGDDGASGQAYRYDLRYSYQPILNADDFLVANLYPIAIYPSASGTVDSLMINIQDLDGYSGYDTVHFALVVEDACQNRSKLSNLASHMYLASPAQVEAVLNDDTSVYISWTDLHTRTGDSPGSKNNSTRDDVTFLGYELWFEHNGSLAQIGEYSNGTSYAHDIMNLGDGALRYGVRVVYDAGVSPLCFSDTITLDRLADVRILCQQSSGHPGAGVQYQIAASDSLYQQHFSGTTNLSGVILLDDVYHGSYEVSLRKENHFPQKYTIEVSEEESEFVLDIHAALPPDSLSISVDDGQVTVSWNQVPGATFYKIYVSEDPMEPGMLISIQSATTFSMNANGRNLFFKVVAGSDVE